MKQNIKYYSIILISLLFLTFISSLILTLLEKNELITYNTSIIIANSVSYLLVAIFGFMLGIKCKKNGLINGIIFSIILIALSLILGNKLNDIVTIIKIVTKSIIIIFFTILGVNKKNSS